MQRAQGAFTVTWDEFDMLHAVHHYRNTKETELPGYKSSGGRSWLRKLHWQHTSDQEVPLSQLYTSGCRGAQAVQLAPVAGHMKIDLA